jgi:hypothetical protein
MSDWDSGQKLAILQWILVAVVGVVGVAFAPDLDSLAQHERFKDFFTTSAQVIAALLVALAVEARFAVRHVLLAITSAVCLVVGELSAIAALSPALPDTAYTVLFASTLAGGTGAMVAAVVIAAQTLVEDAQTIAIAELRALRARAQQDKTTA